MKYNIYLFGSDVNNLHMYGNELLKITKCTEFISFYNIHKSMNSSKVSKHFLSKSLLFEDIENKIYSNNIIIPEQEYNLKDLNDITKIAVDDGKNMRKNTIVIIIKNSWSEIKKSKNRLLQFYKKNKIYNFNEDIFNHRDFFEYTQDKLEDINSNKTISGLIYKVLPGTDVVDGVVGFTEYCLDNKLDDVLYQGE